MNPQNGLKVSFFFMCSSIPKTLEKHFYLYLKIRPFKNAHMSRSTDKELKKLAKYLKCIATLEDFTLLNHSHWRDYYKSKKNQFSKEKKARQG